DVESRSGGSTIKVYERLSNVPIRFRDVQNAAEACISG
ncbi:putative lipoprotein, partial [Pseudomonas savastanoi pv. glycinea str. race 4]